MWGFESDNVIPDIVVMAKGMGNGFSIGAVVAQERIAAYMADRFLFHTYGANPQPTHADCFSRFRYHKAVIA